MPQIRLRVGVPVYVCIRGGGKVGIHRVGVVGEGRTKRIKGITGGPPIRNSVLEPGLYLGQGQSHIKCQVRILNFYF